MSNKKMSKDVVPEGFTLSLALVDALPVLFFSSGMIVISILFGSILFMIGAVLCAFAGAAKVVWKIIVVLRKKNIWWLFVQMRYLMPIGFLLMLISLFTDRSRINGAAVWTAICSMPSVIFFVVGILGMAAMIVFSVKLDSSDVKANWTEQFTNGMAQAAIFLGLLLILL